MFYKINPGSKLHEQLKHLQIQIQEAHTTTHDFVFKTMLEKYGIKVLEYQSARFNAIGDSFYCNTAAGGVVSFLIKEKPNGWKNYGQGYFPKNTKANKELLEEIHALPFIEYEAVNKIIGFKTAYDDDSSRMLRTPGRKLATMENAPHVICFSDWVIPKHYKPKKEMIEITKSEYDKIAKSK
jgi:hypothetical protein